MNAEKGPYRSAQPQDTVTPTTDDPFLTQPVEELFTEQKKKLEQKRPPAWWIRQVENHPDIQSYRKTLPGYISFLAATLYWSMAIGFWWKVAPQVFHTALNSEGDERGWRIGILTLATIVHGLILYSSSIAMRDKLKWTFTYLIFPFSSLWLTGKEFVAYLIGRKKNGFNITPWSDDVGLAEAVGDFRERCIVSEQHKVNQLKESLKTLQTELNAIEKRRNTFEEGAKDAGERGNAYLKAQQTKSAQIESDRAANVRKQIAHTHRYTQIAGDGIKSLEASTDQYTELQLSRIKLRKTDSLSPNDTSDGELRAHMRQILVDIQEAIRVANTPVTRTRIEAVPAMKRTAFVSMDEELNNMAEEELRKGKT